MLNPSIDSLTYSPTKLFSISLTYAHDTLSITHAYAVSSQRKKKGTPGDRKGKERNRTEKISYNVYRISDLNPAYNVTRTQPTIN